MAVEIAGQFNERYVHDNYLSRGQLPSSVIQNGTIRRMVVSYSPGGSAYGVEIPSDTGGYLEIAHDLFKSGVTILPQSHIIQPANIAGITLDIGIDSRFRIDPNNIDTLLEEVEDPTLIATAVDLSAGAPDIIGLGENVSGNIPVEGLKIDGDFKLIAKPSGPIPDGSEFSIVLLYVHPD